MNDFNKLCKEFEEIDASSYLELLAEKSASVLPVLSSISKDGLAGTEIFASFVLSAVIADGVLSEEEYLLLYPLLHAFFDDSIDYDKAKDAVKKTKKEAKELLAISDDIADVLGEVSPELKDDLVIVAMLIAAVDGKISQKEKAWIKRLIKD